MRSKWSKPRPEMACFLKLLSHPSVLLAARPGFCESLARREFRVERELGVRGHPITGFGSTAHLAQIGCVVKSSKEPGLLPAIGSQQNRVARGSIRAAQRGEEAANSAQSGKEAANAPRVARRQQIGSQRAQSGYELVRGSPVASRTAEQS